MAAAKDGDKVKVHYKGMLDDGSVFDTSEGRDPLEFTIGGGDMIPGFEDGVKGMEKGGKKTIKIPCGEAYGPIHPEAIADIKRTDFPADFKPEAGQQLQFANDEGQLLLATIISINDDKVTIDANHPLAGKDLTFDIELVSIN